MAIVTLDGVISGARPTQNHKCTIPTLIAAQGCWSSWGTQSANGNTGLWDNSTDGGVALTSSTTNVAGQIAQHYDPAAGKNSYLSQLIVQAPQVCIVQLCDRLLSCGYNHTGTTALLASATTATFGAAGTVALPARDANGAVSGVGVLAGLELAAASAVGASGRTLVMTYTNSGGTGSKTSPAVIDNTNIGSPPLGTFFRMPLAAGDLGVQSVQSYALSGSLGAGAASLVLYRVLAQIAIPAANVPYAIDALTGGFPQLQNGIVPFFLVLPTTTTGGVMQGAYTETQG